MSVVQAIQDDSGGKANILGGDNIDHCERIYRGCRKIYSHFKKGKNCIKILIFNILITKDEYKSRLTSAITRGAQSGYHQRLDTSVYNIS